MEIQFRYKSDYTAFTALVVLDEESFTTVLVGSSWSYKSCISPVLNSEGVTCFRLASGRLEVLQTNGCTRLIDDSILNTYRHATVMEYFEDQRLKVWNTEGEALEFDVGNVLQAVKIETNLGYLQWSKATVIDKERILLEKG